MIDIEYKDDKLNEVRLADYDLPIYPKDTRGFIYLLVDSLFPEYVKIGRTNNLAKRLSAGYNADKPYPTAKYIGISIPFADVIKVEAMILEKVVSEHGVVPTRQEWFNIEHLDVLKKWVGIAEKSQKELGG